MGINDGVVYNQLRQLEVEGENIKVDGSHRKWRAVTTGKRRFGRNNDEQLHVIDLDAKDRGDRQVKKWLRLCTFTGTVGPIEIVEGHRADGNDTVDSDGRRVIFNV